MTEPQSVTSTTLCTIARDEGPYLLEWLAWHRILGFDHIVVYDNDSRDDSTVILPALQRAGEITCRVWPDQVREQPQLPAYRDALAKCSTEWIAFFDVDEFLVLHDQPRIPDLLGQIPEDCSAIVFNQRFFGSSGLMDNDGRLVIERFTRTAPADHVLNRWVKSMSRTRRVRAISHSHSCELTSGFYAEPGGNPCEIEGQSQTRQINFALAQYNHYILKSYGEYLEKRAKGRVALARDHPEKFGKYTDAFFADHDVNVHEDLSAARWADRVHVERDRLRRICRV